MRTLGIVIMVFGLLIPGISVLNFPHPSSEPLVGGEPLLKLTILGIPFPSVVWVKEVLNKDIVLAVWDISLATKDRPHNTVATIKYPFKHSLALGIVLLLTGMGIFVLWEKEEVAEAEPFFRAKKPIERRK